MNDKCCAHICISLLGFIFQSAFFIVVTIYSTLEPLEIIMAIIFFELTYSLHIFHLIVYKLKNEPNVSEYMEIKE